MQPLRFICPCTRQCVTTGIYADLNALRFMLTGPIPIHCPSCSTTHKVGVKDFLAADGKSGEDDLK